MRKIKAAITMGLIMVALALTTNTAAALEINPKLTIPNKTLPAIFISRHEVIKAIPIYRALRTYGDWRDAKGCHLYTVNQDEFNYWMSTGKFNNDGIAGYISPVPLPYTVPMWNMVKNHLEQYFLTSEASRDYVIGKYGYEDYGISGYVVALDDTDHGNCQMFQWYHGASQNAVEQAVWNADHYYNWAVGNISNYKYEGPQFRIWTDASVLQEIMLLSPNGGESLTAGSKVDIKWSTLIPDGSVNLYYSTDGGNSWGIVREGLDNTGVYTWMIPNEVTSQAIIEARWIYAGIDANCFDQSDKYVAIKASSVILPGNIFIKKVDYAMLTLLSAPSGLTTSSDIWQKQPALYWNDNATNETGYIIERKEVGSSFSKLTQVAANTTKYIDSSAKTGVKYVYRLKAIRNLTSSSYSNEASGSVFALPDVQLPSLPSEEEAEEPDAESGSVSMLFTLNQKTYAVNGVNRAMDTSPVSIEGRTLLPILFAADPLGADTVWDGKESKVTVTLGTNKIELWIGSNTAMINGKAVLIDPSNPQVKPLILNSRTMLPMRFVTEKLGCDVEWIPAFNQIRVNYPGTN